jgi:hypothetical protein
MRTRDDITRWLHCIIHYTHDFFLNVDTYWNKILIKLKKLVNCYHPRLTAIVIPMLSSRVIILCYHLVLSSHVIISCYHPNVIISCYHTNVIMSCYHLMLSSRVIISCYNLVLSTQCYHLVLSSQCYHLVLSREDNAR